LFLESVISLFYGYAYWDLALNLWYYKRLRDNGSIIHHSLYIISWHSIPNITQLYNSMWWLLSGEISTIFLQVGKILKSNNLTRGPMYKHVSTLFALTFIQTRVFLYGWGLYNLPGTFLVLRMVYILNLYWSCIIVKKVVQKFINGDDSD
jgi:hypothetical protein